MCYVEQFFIRSGDGGGGGGVSAFEHTMNDYGHNWFSLVWIAFDAKKYTNQKKYRKWSDRKGRETTFCVLMMTQRAEHITYSQVVFQ